MRVLIAPDSFTGSMTAAEAARAIGEGWSRTAPQDELVLAPLSDGGPGFLDTLHAGLGGELLPVPATDPWGTPILGQVLLVPRAGVPTAYLEVAQAAGGRGGRRGDPGAASSSGAGALVRAAIDTGAARIVVGLGGTLVTDAGAGLLAALGATAVDASGRDATAALLGGGAHLQPVHAVDLGPARDLLAGVDLVMATDVDVPLLGPRGAARGFAAQKGAGVELVEVLEANLTGLAHACGRLPDGRSPAVALGSGAAGGIGFALLHLGGQRVSGIDWVMQEIGFSDWIATCDLVITGEGSFDWQSLHGKAILGVCAAAMDRGLPVLVMAGQVAVGRREWMAIGVSAAFGIIGDGPGPDMATAIARGPELLADVAERAARTWSR